MGQQAWTLKHFSKAQLVKNETDKQPGNYIKNKRRNQPLFYKPGAKTGERSYDPLRNWIIGCHIVEYEQSGKDRAKCGSKVLETLATRLKKNGVKGLAETNLKLYRQFYTTYPLIRQTMSDEIKQVDFLVIKIGQTVPD